MTNHRFPPSERQQDNIVGQIGRLQTELGELRAKLAARQGQWPSPTAAIHSRSVEAILQARRRRDALFGEELFADPAWDMLLELYSGELAQRRITTSELCKASAAPDTTALRWIEKLDRSGLVERHRDPLNGRRVFVALTERASATMRRYFDQLGVSLVTI